MGHRLRRDNMNTIGILFSFILPGCVVLGMALRLIIEGDDVKPA